MRPGLALAAVCTLIAASAPAAMATSPNADSVLAPARTSPAPMSRIDRRPPDGLTQLAQADGDPEATGACIHTLITSVAICNEITRRWCFRAGFASPAFYEGMTCADAKAQGLY